MITWEKIHFTGFKIFWISAGHHFGCYHDSGGHDADGHDDGDDDHDDHIQILAHLSPSSLSWFSLRQGRVARTAGRRTRTNPPRIWANQNIVIIWPPHTPNPPTPRPNSTSVTNKISCRNCHSACFIKTTTSFLRLKWFNYIAYSSLVALYNRPSFCHIILLLNSPKTVHNFYLKNPPKLALCPFVNVNNRIKVDTA